MKINAIIILASMISLGSAFAGADSKKLATRAETLETRREYESVSYDLPTDKRTKRELDVCRAMAAAITQSVVLSETRQERLAHAEDSRKQITLRGHRLTLAYNRDLYKQQCYLAVGPLQKWRTVNGYWAGSRVNSRSIARTLTILSDNGVELKSFTISVSSKRHLEDAKRLVARLRLGHLAIVGLDTTKPNHATTRFNHSNK